MAPNNPRPAAQKQANPSSAASSQAVPNNGDQPTVNRKKQKRRQKQAAKLAAEQATSSSANGIAHTHSSHPASSSHAKSTRNIDYGQYGPDDLDGVRDGDDLFYSDDDDEMPMLESPHHGMPNGKMKRKKKRTSRSDSQAYQSAYPMPGQFEQPPPPPPLPLSATSLTKASHGVSRDRIWNTSTAEERERIKEFWISLEEPERRSLVKVEKEAVLKKMKEQQKHSCSCSVCGRKRTAIEEELEVLYDAYYEELEQYANHRQLGLDSGHPMMPPPSSYPSMPKVPLRQDPRVMNSQPPNPHPMAGSFEADEEELEDEEYSDDEDEYDGSEEGYYPPEVAQGPASDFFNFGKSLTVQGGILTVADDLLKNDGKKFIEMMEQLAERRMQREEEAQYAAAGLRHPQYNGHTHPPLDEDEYDDDEEDYASDEEDYDEDEDEMESMSEEQRMEEGRRMFQIFAARMFEQRVLTAYREKVARERQEKLLEELADEDRLDAEREAKKAKDAQKKKDKKKQQKAAKEEEKRKREAEKVAAEAAAKAAEERKLEEQRQRKEEQRKKREAEKKAQEEEKQRKEADKARRQQEARDLQAEQERKQREAKDKEKKRKEEAKKKERDERAKEKEKKDREAAEKRELEAKMKTEKDAQHEALDREAKAQAKSQEAVKPSAQQPPTVPLPPLVRKTTSSNVPAPPGLGPVSSAHASPHLQIATPVIPKAPTPMRPRQPSRQDSMHSSPKSTQPPSGSSATSPSTASIQQPPPTSLPPAAKQQAPVHTMPQQTPMPAAAPPRASPPGIPPPSYSSMSNAPQMSGSGFPSHFHPMPPPGMQPRAPNHHDAAIYANQPFSAPPYRGFNSPSAMAFPPGISGPRHMPPGRGSPSDAPVAQTPIGESAGPGPIAPTSHSRNASASYESSGSGQTQPIARPAPISRPTNNVPQEDKKNDVDDLSKHLGSSALLDDTDEALGLGASEPRSNMGPAGARSARLGFANPRYAGELGPTKGDTFPRTGWAPQSMGFGTPTMSSHPSWPSAPGAHWSSNNAFGSISSMGRQSRPVSIRLLICQACKTLSTNNLEGVPSGFGYHSIHDVMGQIEHLKPDSGPVPLSEFLAICETEGSGANGGGTLAVQEERSRGTCVKWIPDPMPGSGRMVGGPGHAGEIGSPIVGSVMPFGGGRAFQPHGGGMQAPGFP